MGSQSRRIHGGLILAVGLLGASLTVLILGAARGSVSNAGLTGSTATPFTLRDAAGHAAGIGDRVTGTTILIFAQQDSADFAKPAAAIAQLCDTFGRDGTVRVLGVQAAEDTGLLANAAHTVGRLETACPTLRTLLDADGSVARAYRMTVGPTALVIDDHAVLRARVPLDADGAAVAVVETVNALRPATTTSMGAAALPLPR